VKMRVAEKTGLGSAWSPASGTDPDQHGMPQEEEWEQ